MVINANDARPVDATLPTYFDLQDCLKERGAFLFALSRDMSWPGKALTSHERPSSGDIVPGAWRLGVALPRGTDWPS